MGDSRSLPAVACTFYVRESKNLLQAVEVGMGEELWICSAGDPGERMAVRLGSERDNLTEVTKAVRIYLSRT